VPAVERASHESHLNRKADKYSDELATLRREYPSQCLFERTPKTSGHCRESPSLPAGLRKITSSRRFADPLL
jgi:hypothetical protein